MTTPPELTDADAIEAMNLTTGEFELVPDPDGTDLPSIPAWPWAMDMIRAIAAQQPGWDEE